jgi:hypothetical protein
VYASAVILDILCLDVVTVAVAAVVDGDNEIGVAFTLALASPMSTANANAAAAGDVDVDGDDDGGVGVAASVSSIPPAADAAVLSVATSSHTEMGAAASLMAIARARVDAHGALAVAESVQLLVEVA